MTKLNLYTAIMCLLLIIASFRVQAQCTDITLKLKSNTSTCQANGTFEVTVGGNHVGNLRMTDIQFSVDGTVTRPWSHYPGNIITQLPEGTYTIKVRAFCSSANDFVVITGVQATGTIITDYTIPDVRVEASAVRRTLNCRETGIIPIQISNGKGPYTVKVTNAPGGYAGAPSFTLPTAQTLELKDLPAGNYSFEVKDACSYVYNIPVTIDTMPQDYIHNLFTELRPLSVIASQDCNTIGLFRPALGDNELEHYFKNNSIDYFEIAVVVGGIGPKVWVPLGNGVLQNYTLSKTIKEIRDGNLSIVPYLRVKGTAHPACEFELKPLKPLKLSNSTFLFGYDDVTCNSFSVIINPPTGSMGIICYPYKYRILTTADVVVKNWSGWIHDGAPQISLNIPYGTKIEFEDHEGHKWVQGLRSQVTISTRTSLDYEDPEQANGITNNVFHGYLQLYMNSTPMPAGTIVKYISGPMLPLNTSITTTVSQASGVYYFGQLATGNLASKFSYNLPGTYKFEITLPGCPTEEKIINYSPYTIKTPFAYTQEETCEGLKIIPSGKLGLIDYATGIASDVTTHYSIESAPYNVTVDRTAKDTLLLPATGKYKIKMTMRPSDQLTYYRPAQTIEIDYVKKPLSLNSAVTSAYICQGEIKGNIRVEGANGSGNYSYELYDEDVLKLTNATGYFAYGEASKKYVVRINDLDCNTFFDQEVTMLDLSNAQIVYSGHPADELCAGETIQLNCITLGQTVYEWTGPGITAATKNQQNPRIPNAIAAMSGVYTVTVKPENCGADMVQSINITVNAAPPLPASQFYDPIICVGDNFSVRYFQTILGYTYNLYDAATGGNIIDTGTGTGGNLTLNCGSISTLGTNNYYLEAVSDKGCISGTRKKVDFTVVALPTLPTTATAATVCEGSAVIIEVTTAYAGHTYRVYDAAIGGSLKGSETGYASTIDIVCAAATGTGSITYYLEVDNGECISTARKPVTFTVNASPILPTTATAADVCEGSAVTVQILTSLANHTYEVYDAITLGNIKGIGAGNGGTINIMCGTATGAGSKTYYIKVKNSTTTCESTARKPVTFTVNALPVLPTVTANAICDGETAVIKINASVIGYIYKVYEAATGGVSIAQGTGDGATLSINCGVALTASKTYYVEVVGSGGCVSTSRALVAITVHASLTAGTIGADQTICPGETPLQLTSTVAGGGSGTYSYQWEQSIDGGVWTNAAGVSTNANYSPLSLTTTTEYRRKVSDGACGPVISNSVTISMRKTKSYPDIRIQACPNIGNISLSKYLDTLDVKAVEWSIIAAPAIGFNTNGTVSSNQFVFPDTYVYQYKITNSCGTNEAKLYLKTIKDRIYHLPPDTVVICYENATEIQLNQIMGIEAGGIFEANEAHINTNYITEAIAPAIYAGATIFNGEKAYIELPANATYSYSGPLTTDPLAKKVVFKYTPDAGSCLAGKVYTFVIILTNQLVP